LTSDPEICQDIAELFNYLTGMSGQVKYRKLLVAPLDLREGIIDRIEREVEVYRQTGRGRIAFKLNSLVDIEVIDALYEASQAGVTVDLIVRGICCLRPGVEGLSENIRVVSVVGRFLEHSRAYYFENGGEEEVLIGSADMMRRNLDRRVEVLVPLEDQDQIDYVRDEVIGLALLDNVKAWRGLVDGRYERAVGRKGGRQRNSQVELMEKPATKVLPPA
jgi:polyphosphate kinase